MARRIANHSSGRYLRMTDAQADREQAKFQRAVQRLREREEAARLRHPIQPAFNPDDPGRDKPTCARCGRRIGQTRTGNGWTHLS